MTWKQVPLTVTILLGFVVLVSWFAWAAFRWIWS